MAKRKKEKISLAAPIFIGGLAGILAGLTFGERIAPVQFIGDAFIKLLQMTVLPNSGV